MVPGHLYHHLIEMILDEHVYIKQREQYHVMCILGLLASNDKRHLEPCETKGQLAVVVDRKYVNDYLSIKPKDIRKNMNMLIMTTVHGR